MVNRVISHQPAGDPLMPAHFELFARPVALMVWLHDLPQPLPLCILWTGKSCKLSFYSYREISVTVGGEREGCDSCKVSMITPLLAFYSCSLARVALKSAPNIHLGTALQQVNNIRRVMKEKSWQCYLPFLVQPILVVKMVLHVWLQNKQSLICKTL